MKTLEFYDEIKDFAVRTPQEAGVDLQNPEMVSKFLVETVEILRRRLAIHRKFAPAAVELACKYARRLRKLEREVLRGSINSGETEKLWRDLGPRWTELEKKWNEEMATGLDGPCRDLVSMITLLAQPERIIEALQLGFRAFGNHYRFSRFFERVCYIELYESRIPEDLHWSDPAYLEICQRRLEIYHRYFPDDHIRTLQEGALTYGYLLLSVEQQETRRDSRLSNEEVEDLLNLFALVEVERVCYFFKWREILGAQSPLCYDEYVSLLALDRQKDSLEKIASRGLHSFGAARHIGKLIALQIA